MPFHWFEIRVINVVKSIDKSVERAWKEGGGWVPVSHIPLIIFKNIPHPLNEYGKYPQNSESIVSPYP